MVLILIVAFSNDTLWYPNLTCWFVRSSAFPKIIQLQSFLQNHAKPLWFPDALGNWQHLYTTPDIVMLFSDLGLAPAHRAILSLAMVSTLWLGEQPRVCASFGVKKCGAEVIAFLQTWNPGSEAACHGTAVYGGMRISHPRRRPQPQVGRVQTPLCSMKLLGYGCVAKSAARGGCKRGRSSPCLTSSPLRWRSYVWGSRWGVFLPCTHCLDLHSCWARN